MPIIQHHDEKIVLVPGNKAPISPGESPKYFLTDGHNSYIVKKPKARSFAGIFKKNFPKNLEHYKNWTLSDFYAKQETLPVDHKTKLLPYLQH